MFKVVGYHLLVGFLGKGYSWNFHFFWKVFVHTFTCKCLCIQLYVEKTLKLI